MDTLPTNANIQPPELEPGSEEKQPEIEKIIPSEPTPPPQPTPPQEKEPSSKTELPRLRTMKYDAQRYLKDKNISFLDLVSQEKEYAREHPQQFQVKERASEQIWFRSIVGLIAVVFLGIIGYGTYVFLATRNSLPSAEGIPARSFIHTEEREVITVREGDRTGLLTKLEAARRDRLPSRSIKHVVVRADSLSGSSHFASAKNFFQTLDFKTPSGLEENLNDKFDFLLYFKERGADGGFIFEPKDTNRALAQMLSWESTILLDFRHLYFDNDVTQPGQLFQDKIIKNVDVRSISLPEGLNFVYGIFAGRFLIISTSEEAMEVILGRLFVAPPR